ncbi:MAG TPA: hypothetical protein VFK21_13600 [Gammaproteobacteria bacterium]|nr:hypothetical protein [Gammaproteobacteria bacterium]
MESIELDYKLGHDVYRISVTVVIDATLGRKMYRPELVIEKNISDLDAEQTRRVRVMQLFTSHEKAQRYALGYAKRLIEGDPAASA